MIGKMRHRVLLQQPVEVVDAGGGRALTWRDIETVYGEVKPVRGADGIHAMANAYPVTHTVRIRYRSDVTNDWRVVYDSRKFNVIAAVDPDERKNYLILSVEEGLPTGGGN